MKRISVVSTLYYSEKTVEEFCDRVISAVEELGDSVPELILVDDGSPDNSRQLSLNLLKKDKRVTLVELSKNFGHHHAMMAGLAQATGDFVFLIDSDLEEPPEALREFFDCIKNEDLDVVYGKQQKRRGSLVSRLIGKIYYLSFRFLTGIDQPDDIVTCRLMSKGYVEALLLHKESELSIGGIWLQTGFNQKAVELVKGNSSKTTYTMRKKLSTGVNAVTSFSNTPLYLNFFVGCLTLLFSISLILYYLLGYFINGNEISGFVSIAILILLSLGINAFSNGINSVYLAKVFLEVKDRPRYIIKKIHNSK